MNEQLVKFLQLNRGDWIVQNNIYNLYRNDSFQSIYQTNIKLNHVLSNHNVQNKKKIVTMSNNQSTDYFVIPNQQYEYTGIIIRHDHNSTKSLMSGSFLLLENLSMITYFDHGQFQIYEKIWFEHINLRLKIQVIKEFGHSIFIAFYSDIRKQNT